MANNKVFGSDITRTFHKLNNNLYDLITINPVKPLEISHTKYLSCDFVPKTDKYFIPKRKIRPKVRTVRDIRNAFEKEVCGDLSIDIEKQENVLLRKIRGGSSKDEKTKLFAGNLLKSEKPISRMAWQMIVNINPDNYAHSSQYLLWNGKCIQVNGSRGGKSKFIYKYDLEERRTSLFQRYKLKKKYFNPKKNLLKNSLNIKFKPGPLSRKKELDISYQKYNIGMIELVDLPKPGLEIFPEYGKPLEMSIANFLHNLRDVDGIISDKWAEFAVSVLGTIDGGRAIQLHKDTSVTFDLGYKYNQRRLLMRYDADNLITQNEKLMYSNYCTENVAITEHEIKQILDDMLISIEIKLMENNMYTGEDPPRVHDPEDLNTSFRSHPKDKGKRKGQSELHRLDVTVIRLCDSQGKSEVAACRKSFCALGCVCNSIRSPFRLKNHCGLIECMFECKCDYNKYNLHSYLEDDIIPGLVSLDKETNTKLSKEEQKFHQTVILSGEKSIVLKSQRRNWKAPEKYADFYSNMCLKAKKDVKRILSVLEIKLNCGNIEPWCMIHNLYKCFCKGKFTENLSTDVSTVEPMTVESEHTDTYLGSLEKLQKDMNDEKAELSIKSILRPRLQYVNSEAQTTNSCAKETNVSLNNCYQQCARVKAYKKRKYSDVFYFNTNKKIMELEQNDHGLQKRMMKILKSDESSDINKDKNDYSNHSAIDTSSSSTLDQISQRKDKLDESNDETQNKLVSSLTFDNLSGDIITTQFTSPTERLLNQKLRAWLEPSLKLYRQRFGKGFFKKSLEPPKAGKITLYPWDFIMTRYHEKKNLFLVTIQKPFRIFMAVDKRNSLFNNCIDISSIEDLEHYPVSVKNIITKKVDCLTDQLCILRGLSFCWELVGSVKKVCDRNNSESKNYSDELSLNVDPQSPRSSSPYETTPVKATSIPVSVEKHAEQSKWFFMTIENDFSEIQFHSRGFFVKYDSIIRAVNVARMSHKTVRLSSQKCGEESTEAQFGIYAIPNANEYWAFIGPYAKNQPLGIEIIKNNLCNQKLRTRGVWITTNKVDDLKVIDDPLPFMSEVNFEYGHVLDDGSQDETIVDSLSYTKSTNDVKAKESNKVVKLVKPIKITKTNNFYHLTPSGFLEPISPEKQVPKIPVIIKNRLPLHKSTSNSPLLHRTLRPQLNENSKYLCIEENQRRTSKRPIVEIAPQVKIIDDCRESTIQTNENTQHKTFGRRYEGGMFILKPEEINSRSLVKTICLTPPPAEENSRTITEIDMDIENFLANSVECSAPSNDVYVISDDEDYCSTEILNTNSWKDVWIICKNVKKMGWIAGRQDAHGNLSFEFPGFKYTAFYPEKDAFAKITQVLARKVYIPEKVVLRWSVLKTKKELQKLKKLKREYLNPDYVLTKGGLIHKSHIAERLKKEIKTSTRNTSARGRTSKSSLNIRGEKSAEWANTKSSIAEMDTKSDELIKEGEKLLSDTMLKKVELSESISKMSNDRRQKISDRLRSIISSANGS